MSCCKPSKYNQLIEMDNGNLIIYNSLYNTYLKIPESLKNTIFAILHENRIRHDDKIYDELLKKQFVYEDDRDEDALVTYYRDTIIYSNDMLHITIIPTDACNFKCKYCYQSGVDHFMTEKEIQSVILYFKNTVPKFKGVYISWFGGEPLMATDTVLIIMRKLNSICKENRVPLYSQMTTNGYNLTPDLFKELLCNHVLWYMITIDGIEKTHNYQRPHKTNSDSFQKIISNLIHIRDQVKRNNFRIGIRINISPVIIPHLSEFVDMFAYEFSNDTRFALTWEWVKNWGGERIEENKDLVLKSFEESHFADFENLIMEKHIAIERGQAFTNLGSELCMAYRKNGFTINYDGNVYKCPMALYREEYADINHVGYLDEVGRMIINVLKNSKWVGAAKASEDCKACLQFPVCMGLICPLASKIQGKFKCDGGLMREIPSYIRNCDCYGKFDDFMLK